MRTGLARDAVAARAFVPRPMMRDDLELVDERVSDQTCQGPGALPQLRVRRLAQTVSLQGPDLRACAIRRER